MKSKPYLPFILICIIFTSLFSPERAEANRKVSQPPQTMDSAPYTAAPSGEAADAADWPEGPAVDADSAILMDLSTGLVLYEKNSHKKQYPASITKIMTTLLAIENCSAGEIVTFSHDAVFGIEPGSTHIGIDVGEKLTMEQCLYAVMLASANEVSSGVAEHTAGSIAAFADLMNRRAKELGCRDTHFVNANGLHDDEHYTSAYDMALIGREAMRYSTFRKLIATKRYTIPPTNKHENENIFLNHHQMFYGNKYPQYEYEGCLGGKTGYTTKAGSTLVTFAARNGIELVCVVMRANGPTSPENQYTDTRALLDFGFENYKKYEISNDPISTVDFPLFTTFCPFFSSTESPLSFGDNAYVLLPKTARFEDAKQDISFYNNAELKDGTNVIGTISYTFAGKTVGSTDIVYDKQSDYTTFLGQGTRIVENEKGSATRRFNLKPMIVSVIIAVIVFLTWIYFHIRTKRKRKSRRYDLRF